MAVQIVLCMETNKRADTDGIYIMETIRHVYVVNNKTKISKVYMNTKSKYRSNDVLREIAKLKKEYIIGQTKVIYCIDTDDYEKNVEHKTEFDAIEQFCENNSYDLVWFCHDVEDVYVGKKISDSQKVQEAASYRRRKNIEKIHIDTLSSSIKRDHTSNILKVLDKYLLRK